MNEVPAAIQKKAKPYKTQIMDISPLHMSLMIGWIRYNRHEPPILVIHSYHHFILKERELKGKKIHFLVSNREMVKYRIDLSNPFDKKERP
jgi:hypothetical protein